jgi:SNF2 family DNA or RNA helicase
MKEAVKISKIHEAIRAIATRCDGALSDDGVGFNGVDAQFGNSLSDRDELTARQALAAHKMLRKYRGQLSKAGIDYGELEEPEVPVRTAIGRKITIEGKSLIFIFDFDYEIKEAIKRIPGKKWSKTKKQWSAPINGPVLDLVSRFAVQYDFTLDERVIALMDSRIEEIEHISMLSHAEDADLDPEKISNLAGTLRPFQRAGVAYAVQAKRCFIADDMGLGKTIESIAAVEHEQAYPCLVVCPASVKLNWEREWSKWVPSRYAQILYGTTCGYADTAADVTIVNWDILKHWIDALDPMEFKSIIFDESQYAKGHKTQRTKAARLISKGVEYVFCLTGTPVVNRTVELLPQLQIIDRLDEFGGFWGFVKRYCAARQVEFPGRKPFWDFSGSSYTEELNRTLRSTCYIRRLKKDVLKDLPAKQRTVVPVEIDNYRAYKEVEDNFVEWLAYQEISDEQWLASIEDMDPEDQLREIQEKKDTATEKARHYEALMKIEKLRQLALEGKMSSCLQWIEDFLESGEKLVVFAWHQDAAQRLSEVFSCNAITGSTSQKKRQEYVDDFQDNPNTKIIVCNIKAGGVGITLTAASNVMFMEMGWSPADMDQAEDRLHRIGQENSVNCWYLIAQSTIEQHIEGLISSKRAIVDSATEGTKRSVYGGLLLKMKGD